MRPLENLDAALLVLGLFLFFGMIPTIELRALRPNYLGWSLFAGAAFCFATAILVATP